MYQKNASIWNRLIGMNDKLDLHACSRKIPCTKCNSYFSLVVKMIYFSDISGLDPLVSFLIVATINMQSQVKKFCFENYFSYRGREH